MINDLNIIPQPLGERVLLKPVESVEKTTSGLYIPDNAKERPQEAEVVAIGNKVEYVSVGTKVMYGKYSGTEISYNNDKFIIMKEEDILAIV